jgi:hypothetical protein
MHALSFSLVSSRASPSHRVPPLPPQLGSASLFLALGVYAFADAYLYMPGPVGDSFTQAALQQFAWTEAALPGAQARRDAALAAAAAEAAAAQAAALSSWRGALRAPVEAAAAGAGALQGQLAAAAGRLGVGSHAAEPVPMFCVESCVKLLCWARLAYRYWVSPRPAKKNVDGCCSALASLRVAAPLPVSSLLRDLEISRTALLGLLTFETRALAQGAPAPLETPEYALSLFGLDNLEALHEEANDTRALVAWGGRTVVVAFRGTASRSNILTDLKVQRPAPASTRVSASPLLLIFFTCGALPLPAGLEPGVPPSRPPPRRAQARRRGRGRVGRAGGARARALGLLPRLDGSGIQRASGGSGFQGSGGHGPAGGSQDLHHRALGARPPRQPHGRRHEPPRRRRALCSCARAPPHTHLHFVHFERSWAARWRRWRRWRSRPPRPRAPPCAATPLAPRGELVRQLQRCVAICNLPEARYPSFPPTLTGRNAVTRRVGNRAYARLSASLAPHTVAVVRMEDPIPRIPKGVYTRAGLRVVLSCTGARPAALPPCRPAALPPCRPAPPTAAALPTASAPGAARHHIAMPRDLGLSAPAHTTHPHQRGCRSLRAPLPACGSRHAGGAALAL